MTAARTFAFRPRYRGLAFGSIGVGGTVTAIGAVIGFAALPLVSGLAGVALGVAYLASPTWKIVVAVGDDGLVVRSPTRVRFQLAWADVVRVVASPTTHTCFVDGGAPERSLLVPGDGAPAPYDIADRAALFEAILAHVAPDKVKIVGSLDEADGPVAPDAAGDKPATPT